MNRTELNKHIRRMQRAQREVQECWNWLHTLPADEKPHPQTTHSWMQGGLHGIGGVLNVLAHVRQKS